MPAPEKLVLENDTEIEETKGRGSYKRGRRGAMATSNSYGSAKVHEIP
jgi:hypothetical protein